MLLHHRTWASRIVPECNEYNVGGRLHSTLAPALDQTQFSSLTSFSMSSMYCAIALDSLILPQTPHTS